MNLSLKVLWVAVHPDIKPNVSNTQTLIHARNVGGYLTPTCDSANGQKRVPAGGLEAASAPNQVLSGNRRRYPYIVINYQEANNSERQMGE